MPSLLRQGIYENLMRLCRSLPTRSLLLRVQNLGSLLVSAIEETEQQLAEAAVKLLCELSSISNSFFYIPGETAEVLKLQTEAK